MDMFSAEIDEECFARTYVDSHETIKPALDSETALRIVKRLVEAESPLIHAGGGILLAQASDELSEFAQFLDLPISRTLMGHGCIPDNHPLLLGQTGFWGLGFTHSKTLAADMILALGTRLAEADSSSWYEGVTFSGKSKFIQIDIDPMEIGRNYPVEIGAIADLKQALKQLLEAAKKIKPEGMKRAGLREEIAREKAAFKRSNESIYNDSRFPMTPQRILRDVKKALPEDALIFTDVGWNKNGVAQQFDINVPGCIHHPSGLATMGFGSAALLGAKLAAPDRKVVTLIGDGGFGTNPSVIATAVEFDIAVVWIVMNNAAFGTIAGLKKLNYGSEFGTLFKAKGQKYTPDWSAIAKGYGIKAIKVESADAFYPALKDALDSNEPYLIDCFMENIPVPTPGRWNINDIFSPKGDVTNGRLLFKTDKK